MKTGSVILLVLIILGIAVIIYGILNKKTCQESDSNFECVKKMGATKSISPTAGDRYDFPQGANAEYGFYSNNRAARFSDKKKGSYDKVKITFDDGSTITLQEIFKKK